MGPRDSLAFVRSRSGPRADFERIDRQQQFIRSVLVRLLDGRLLTDPARLYQLVDDVASNLVTDDRLGISEMRSLSTEMIGVVRDGLPMMTLPSYPRTVAVVPTCCRTAPVPGRCSRTCARVGPGGAAGDRADAPPDDGRAVLRWP
jgi:hypothetical protein